MARPTEPRPSDPDFDVLDCFDDDSPTPVLAVGTRDNLEQKAREATRRAATVEDEDVASLAHDLKNPLTIIMLEATQIEQRLALRTLRRFSAASSASVKMPRTSIGLFQRPARSWLRPMPASWSCASIASTSSRLLRDAVASGADARPHSCASRYPRRAVCCTATRCVWSVWCRTSSQRAQVLR